MKKAFSIFLGVCGIFLFHVATASAECVICDPSDALCMMDCSCTSAAGECGVLETTTPDAPSCPTDEKVHPITGSCICANDSCCQANFEHSVYDGNGTDGCACAENATFDGVDCICNEGYEWNGTMCYDDGKPKNDAECQAKYGIAYFDEQSPTNCHCDVPDAKTKLVSGQIQCVYTNDYLNRQCLNQYGPSFWSASSQECVCTDYTEMDPATGQCTADTLEQIEAKQELQYYFYRRIATMGYFLGGEAEKAAYMILNMGVDDYDMDSGRMKAQLLEKANFYSKMSTWNLSDSETIRKAVNVLKGRTTRIGDVQRVIASEGTVSAMVNDNWLAILNGKVRVDDSNGSAKLNVMTPNGFIQPKGTIYEVEYDADTGVTSVNVIEGSVSSSIATSGDSSLSTTTVDSNGSSTSDSILDAIGYTGATSNSSCFNDTSGNAYETAICYVKSEGIVNGYGDGSYKPNSAINRAEFTKIIMAATYSSSEIVGSECFSDVHSEWFAPYICGAKTKGIAGGNPDGTFRPANNINLAEALKIILEAAAKDAGVSVPDTGGEWYQKYIDFANDLALLTNINNDPAHALTRGEMADIVYRAGN